MFQLLNYVVSFIVKRNSEFLIIYAINSILYLMIRTNLLNSEELDPCEDDTNLPPQNHLNVGLAPTVGNQSEEAQISCKDGMSNLFSKLNLVQTIAAYFTKTYYQSLTNNTIQINGEISCGGKSDSKSKNIISTDKSNFQKQAMDENCNFSSVSSDSVTITNRNINVASQLFVSTSRVGDNDNGKNGTRSVIVVKQDGTAIILVNERINTAPVQSTMQFNVEDSSIADNEIIDTSQMIDIKQNITEEATTITDNESIPDTAQAMATEQNHPVTETGLENGISEIAQVMTVEQDATSDISVVDDGRVETKRIIVIKEAAPAVDIMVDNKRTDTAYVQEVSDTSVDDFESVDIAPVMAAPNPVVVPSRKRGRHRKSENSKRFKRDEDEPLKRIEDNFYNGKLSNVKF